MSVHFISGKPGGGKSMYAMKLLIHELRFGSRIIVTNLAIKFEGLGEYVANKWPDWYASQEPLRNRFVMLEDADLKSFFRFRGGGVILPAVSRDGWEKRGERTDYSLVKDGGVFYALDEVHIPFNARAWQDTGPEVLYYLSQHRKLGDDLLAITQFVGNVDKQFRTMTQDYTYLRNLSKERLGHFKLPSLFTRFTYAQPANGTEKPMESGMFRLDVEGLGSCYDTAKGVGIHGRAADTGQKKKGIHWALFPVCVALFLLGFFTLAPKVIAKLALPKSAAKTQSQSVQRGFAVNQAPQAVSLAVQQTNALAGKSTATNVLWVVAICPAVLQDGRIFPVKVLTLSDGSKLLYDDITNRVTHAGFWLDEERTQKVLWQKPSSLTIITTPSYSWRQP